MRAFVDNRRFDLYSSKYIITNLERTTRTNAQRRRDLPAAAVCVCRNLSPCRFHSQTRPPHALLPILHSIHSSFPRCFAALQSTATQEMRAGTASMVCRFSRRPQSGRWPRRDRTSIPHQLDPAPRRWCPIHSSRLHDWGLRLAQQGSRCTCIHRPGLCRQCARRSHHWSSARIHLCQCSRYLRCRNNRVDSRRM